MKSDLLNKSLSPSKETPLLSFCSSEISLFLNTLDELYNEARIALRGRLDYGFREVELYELMNALSDPRCSVDLLKRYATNHEKRLRCSVASNPMCTTDILYSILQYELREDKNPYQVGETFAYIANNPNSTIGMKKTILRTGSIMAYVGLALDPKCPTPILDILELIKIYNDDGTLNNSLSIIAKRNPNYVKEKGNSLKLEITKTGK